MNVDIEKIVKEVVTQLQNTECSCSSSSRGSAYDAQSRIAGSEYAGMYRSYNGSGRSAYDYQTKP